MKPFDVTRCTTKYRILEIGSFLSNKVSCNDCCALCCAWNTKAVDFYVILFSNGKAICFMVVTHYAMWNIMIAQQKRERVYFKNEGLKRTSIKLHHNFQRSFEKEKKIFSWTSHPLFIFLNFFLALNLEVIVVHNIRSILHDYNTLKKIIYYYLYLSSIGFPANSRVFMCSSYNNVFLTSHSFAGILIHY